MSASETQVQPAGWYDDPAGQARFRFWDGRHWTHQTTNAKNPGSSAPALGAGFARLGDWLSCGMALVAVAAMAVVVVIAWASTELGSLGTGFVHDFGPDASSYAGADTGQAGAASTVGLALLVAFAFLSLSSLVTGVLWVCWQYQLAESAPAQLRRGPGMHVVSWFIPVVSYWWPYQNMVDLWQAYGAGRDRTQPDVASGIGVWWGTMLGLPFVVGLAGGFLLASSTPDNVLSRFAVFYGALFATTIVSALLARGVVTRLSWRALEHCASVQ